MKRKLNLCEILKGHEGETFYSPAYSNLILYTIDDDYIVTTFDWEDGGYVNFNHNGTLFKKGELMLFPSKDQRDWNKWIEEQKSKTPKTWSEFINVNHINLLGGIGDYCIDITGHENRGWTRRKTPIEKSALALLKIHQLIEVGYGGNVSKDYIKNLPIDKTFYFILYNHDVDKLIILSSSVYQHNTINFKTKEQSEEFLSYPENVQLLKDYFMI